MMRRSYFLAAVISTLSGSLCAQGMTSKDCGIDPFFACTAPVGWGIFHDPEYSRKIEKAYGVNLVGPAGKSGAHVSIDAVYYAPGNSVHKSAEKYIQRVARLDGRVVGLPGEKASPPERTQFKGRPATSFKRTTFDFIRVSKTSDKQVTVQEEYLVIPATTGYYVLQYRAPPSLVKEYRPVFERFKESFKMLVK